MSKIPLGTPGIIYILSNESMPGILKIGATTDTAVARAKQLSSATAAATPFVVLYSKSVSDCNEVEAQMHRAFADRRVNDGREFFEVSLYEVATTLDRICGSRGFNPEPQTPWAELFATFPDDGSARELTAEERAKCRALDMRTI